MYFLFKYKKQTAFLQMCHFKDKQTEHWLCSKNDIDQYDLYTTLYNRIHICRELIQCETQCISMRTDFCTHWKLYKNMKINATALANHTI